MHRDVPFPTLVPVGSARISPSSELTEDRGSKPVVWQVKGDREAIQGFVLKKLLYASWPAASGKKEKSVATEVACLSRVD